MDAFVTFCKVTFSTAMVVGGQFCDFCVTAWPTVKSYAIFVYHNVVILADAIVNQVKVWVA